jgi:hypothetical protein
VTCRVIFLLLLTEAGIPEVIKDQGQDHKADNPKWKTTPEPGSARRYALGQTENKYGYDK